MEKSENSELSMKEFSELSDEARKKVEEWPEWKRNIKITYYSVDFDLKTAKKEPNSEKK